MTDENIPFMKRPLSTSIVKPVPRPLRVRQRPSQSPREAKPIVPTATVFRPPALSAPSSPALKQLPQSPASTPRTPPKPGSSKTSRDYICQICSKSFTRAFSLKTHQFLHATSKPIPCVICHKTFVSERHLQNHLRVHTGDRPFLCTFGDCKAAYTANSSLKRHMAVCPYRLSNRPDDQKPSIRKL